MRHLLTLASIALLAAWIPSADAQVKVETVVGGLYNPCGVAIQPETGDLFVADSGALRVVRVVDGKAHDVIVGFPKDVYGKGPEYDIGPLGLAFLDKDTLVVGGGGNTDDKELLRIYTVPAADADPIKAEDMKASFGLPANEDLMPEGNFYAVAATKTGIFVTCNGDDTKGWVAKADVKDGKVDNFRRFIATKELVEVDAPVGITISPRGEVVVGQMGEINLPGDSLLTFYNANNGKKLSNFETGLHDISAVAYSTQGKTKQLYALDFAWLDAKEGGLFQLIAKRKDGKQTIEAKKIVALDKPTAMIFADDGTLYITVIGTAEEGSDAKPGKLLKIAPGL